MEPASPSSQEKSSQVQKKEPAQSAGSDDEDQTEDVRFVINEVISELKF